MSGDSSSSGSSGSAEVSSDSSVVSSYGPYDVW